VYEECNDFEKKIPFLVPEEECEEIFYDECQEVEERVPVELCRNIRVNEEAISLHRGRTIRKEGEKRRRKTTQGGRTTQTQSGFVNTNRKIQEELNSIENGLRSINSNREKLRSG
jgi:hypothetical protein